MKKRLLLSIPLGIAILLVVVLPVLASYFTAITITESSGNDYDSIPLIIDYDVQGLVDSDIISSSGRDTRIYTGDDIQVPHMLANDKVLLATDLVALEERGLIFYSQYPSLDSFPVILGGGGSIRTPDDPSLEPDYNFELFIPGIFNSSAGSNKNLGYKQNAYRMYISDDDELTIAGLNASGSENWTMVDDTFDSGEHTVYVKINGFGASLFVDDMVLAKDTASLVYSVMPQLTTSTISDILPQRRQVVCANGVYWAFGRISSSLYYWTSPNGQTWGAGTSIPHSGVGVTGYHSEVTVWEHDDYAYIAVIASHSGYPYSILYRRGYLEGNETITWGANWSRIHETDIYSPSGGQLLSRLSIATDMDGYPVILGTTIASKYFFTIKSSTKDTWTMAGGYPQSWSYSPTLGGTSIAGYPNATANKMYAIWSYAQTNYAELLGRYYYSGSWYGIETIVPYSASYNVDQFSLAADMDDNVYIVWHLSTGGTYLRVRYSDGTWGSTTLLSATGTYPNVLYNEYTNYIYIIYLNGGAVVGKCITGTEIGEEQILYVPSGTGSISTMIYPEQNMGALFFSSSDKGCYLDLEFSWQWNDNSNSWYWMQNNVMSYADYIESYVDGDLVLHYQPRSIIQGTTLPDRSGEGNDGIITWGNNPAGVTTFMGILGPSQDMLPIPVLPVLPDDDIPDPSSTLPWYSLIHPAALGLGWRDIDFWSILIIFVAIAMGVGVMIATGSTLLAAVTVTIVLVVGINMGILSWWVVIVYAIFSGSYLIAVRSM